jgi:hypothetical protein
VYFSLKKTPSSYTYYLKRLNFKTQMDHLGVKRGNSFRLIATNARTQKQQKITKKWNKIKTATNYSLLGQQGIQCDACTQASSDVHCRKMQRCKNNNEYSPKNGHNINASIGHTEYPSKRYSFVFRADYPSAISYTGPSNDSCCLSKKKPITIMNFKGTRQCNSIIYLSIHLYI